MRILIQRVKNASVTIGGQLRSQIGAGLLVLLGVGADDTDEDAEYLAGKLVRLRIFDDAQGVMNLDVRQAGGQVLVVSQFTLLASTRKGNRPSYIKAAPEAVSRPMYERFAARVAELLGREVMTGEFGADMQVALVNDGPVTIWIDSKMSDCYPKNSMKRFLVVLCAGMAAFFASCNDEETGKENKWFFAPEAGVSGTTVEVSCRTKFGDGVLSSAQAGFAYAPIRSDNTGSFTETTDVTVDGQVMSCRLTGLDAETSYLIYAFVDMGSGGRMQSKPVVVKTGVDPVLPDDPRFGVPECSQVTASSATVSCTFDYTGGKEVSEAYFLYGTATSDDGQLVAVTTEPGAKSATLTGLSASTKYKFRLCVVVGGETFGSTVGTFATSAAGGGDGRTKYAGWAELPVEAENGDYHYAYHICPDFKVDGHEARNFTVCYSAEHHSPVWVAAPVHNCYVGSSGNRNYGPDPVIPSSIQPSGSKASMGSPYNRGHMLGNHERSRTSGMNKQVSYYTNIAAQHGSTFNTGDGAWNNLEDKIDDYWCADTLYVVVGAYYDKWTDSYGNSAPQRSTSFGNITTDVPTMFYTLCLRTKKGNTNKSVMNCAADELQCAAFVMSHAMGKGHDPQAGDMRSVKEIEELTGFTFFANVPNAPKDTYNASDWGL